MRVKDDMVFSIVYEYIKGICRTILDSIESKSLDSLVYSTDEDGYVLDHLFVWPRNSAFSSDALPFYKDELRNYLRTTFNWDRVNRARIEPNYKNNVINIVDPSDTKKSISLHINEKDHKANLWENGRLIHGFIVTGHELFLSVDIKTDKRKIDFFLEYLVDKCKYHTTSFLTNLRIQVNPTHQDYTLLSKDEIFLRALKNIDSNTDIRPS